MKYFRRSSPSKCIHLAKTDVWIMLSGAGYKRGTHLTHLIENLCTTKLLHISCFFSSISSDLKTTNTTRFTATESRCCGELDHIENEAFCVCVVSLLARFWETLRT